MDSFTFTLFFGAIAAAGILSVLWSWGWKKRNRPPGPSFALPLVGHLPQIDPKVPINVTFSKWSDKFGPVIGVWLGSSYTVVLSDPKTIRETLNDPNMNGRPDNQVFRALTGGDNAGLLFADGHNWSEQRRFTLRHLREFGFGKNEMEVLILDEARDLVDGLQSELGVSVTGLGRRFSLAVLSSLWVLVSGQRLQHDDPKMKEILEEIFHQLDTVFMEKGLAFMPLLASLTPTRSGFSDLKRAVERVNAFLQPYISQHEEARRGSQRDQPPEDFIDSYLDEMSKHINIPGSSFHKEQGYKNLIAVITDLFGAGAETTSTTLDWAVLYLATYQDVQKELQAEIAAVIGTHRLPSLSDKAAMPYTEAVMMEILRFSSIAGLGVFHTAIEDTTIGGYDVPAGSWVVPNLRDVHFNPALWGKPEEFNPSRFLERVSVDDNESGSDGAKVLKVKRSENLMPFAVGKRVCLGETLAKNEFFLFLTCIFQRFVIKLDPANPPSAGAAPRKTFILKPHPYHVIIKERH